MKVLILGCGWVGEEFAAKLYADGHQIWVTTTKEQKKAHFTQLGYTSEVLDFDVSHSSSFSGYFDIVLTSVPASSKNSLEDIIQRFSHVQSLLSTLMYGKHIFLSSIGIYPDIDAVYEEDYDGILNERLFCAEQSMRTLPNTSIFRLGGLFGKNRIFAKYFAGKICTSGNQLANFVHIDDVIRLISLGFEKIVHNAVFNIVAPEHPFKKEVILYSAKKYNFENPLSFEPMDSFQKRVSSDKIVNLLSYQFIHPNPLFF